MSALAQAMTDARVSEQLAARQPTDLVTYKGETMTRAMAQAEMERTAHLHTATYFDPTDVISEINHTTFKAMCFGSLEWYMSNSIINKARDVFFQLRSFNVSSGNAIDDFNDFISAIADLNHSASYANTWGFEENTSSMTELAIMCDIRQHWYDLADKAHSAAKMAYKHRTLEELMRDEKMRSIDNESDAKLTVLAEFAGGGNDADTKLAKELLRKQQIARFEEQFKTRQQLIPAVLQIVANAEYRSDHVGEFHHLPDSTKQAFTQHTLKIIDQTLTTIVTWRSISAIDFATSILPDARRAKTTLNEALATFA